MTSFREQIRSNSLALISLAVAFIALGYNTWRNETTESHRNIREASFRVLESLGELQEVADHRYYYFPFENNDGREGELRLRGFGQVAMVRDLMNLMPVSRLGYIGFWRVVASSFWLHTCEAGGIAYPAAD